MKNNRWLIEYGDLLFGRDCFGSDRRGDFLVEREGKLKDPLAQGVIAPGGEDGCLVVGFGADDGCSMPAYTPGFDDIHYPPVLNLYYRSKKMLSIPFCSVFSIFVEKARLQIDPVVRVYL